jgi:putative transposase
MCSSRLRTSQAAWRLLAFASAWTGGGRALDNIFAERLWRSVKYEDRYLKDYASVPELEDALGRYFHLYNHVRPHQSLQYRTPAEVHFT